MNKRAETLGGQLMIFWFLFIIAVIAVGIVGGLLVFFGSEYDVRGSHATIMNFKIRECIEKNLFSEENFAEEFYQKCSFNRKIKDIVIEVKKIQDNREKVLFSFGDPRSCELNEDGRSKNFPVCKKSDFMVNNERWIILTGSNQRLRRSI